MPQEERAFQRMTKQRRVILEVLRKTDSHPTADWIYNTVRDRVPRISLGTVYRNLNRLVEMGEIQQLDFGDGSSRYDANTEPHYHFICDRCERCYDLSMTVDQGLEREAEKVSGFEVEAHRLEFIGRCRRCLAAENQRSKV